MYKTFEQFYLQMYKNLFKRKVLYLTNTTRAEKCLKIHQQCRKYCAYTFVHKLVNTLIIG